MPILDIEAASARRFASAADGSRRCATPTCTIRKGRVRLPDRRLGLRQIDAAAHRRRLRDADARRGVMWGKPIAGPGPDRGMVFQDYALFPWLTVRENIGFGPPSRGLPRPKFDEIVDRFIDMVGLTQFADAYPHQLSGGMKQRVAIARVLANDAEMRADGRALRRARRHDARTPAGRTARHLAAHQADRDVRHALDRGGDLPGRPRGGDDAGAGPHRQRTPDRPAAPARCRLARVQRGAARSVRALHSHHARKVG